MNRLRWINRFVPLLVILLVGITGAHYLSSINAAPTAAIALGSPSPLQVVTDQGSDAVTPQATSASEPSSSLAPDPDFPQDCDNVGYDNSSNCNTNALSAINHAQNVLEGLSGLGLNLSAYESMPAPDQIFVVTNMERIERGLAPAVALTSQLNAAAAGGAATANDPSFSATKLTGGDAVHSWSSVEASGSDNALGADYYYMYDDGYGGLNTDCGSPGAAGCWGHRENILGTYATSADCSGKAANTYMGTAAQTSYMASIFVGACGAAPTDETFTWQQALVLLGGGSNPTTPTTPTSPTTPTTPTTKVKPPAKKPKITALGSTSGSYTGGVVVVISGQYFENSDGSSAVTGVSFGGAQATSFEVTASTYMIATSPGDPTCQTIPITVTTSKGTSNAVNYTYTGCPAPVTPPAKKPKINALGSTSGSHLGGVNVVISGNYFENSDGTSAVTGVSFGGAQATAIVVTAPTYMVATSPGSLTCQTIKITVTTSKGTSNAVNYTYDGCTPTNISPSSPAKITALGSYSGSYIGGVTVVISGSGFESNGSPDVTSVAFGSAQASSFTVTADSYMIATTPGSLTCQTVPVTVTTALGTSNSVDYSYVDCPTPVTPPSDPPIINALGSWDGSDPYSGSYTGGVTVVISGDNFTNSDGSSDVSSVWFGQAQASSYTVTASDYMIATTPGSLTCQTVPLTVDTSQGESNIVYYTYTGCPAPVTPPPGAPTITALGSWDGSDAYDGSYVGGVVVVISGNNYENSDGTSAVLGVAFGAAESPSWQVTADGYMIAYTPGSLTCQTVPVSVATTQGVSSQPIYYTYTGCVNPPAGPPSIAALGSYSGSYIGGIGVVISGQNFENSDNSNAVTSVLFGQAEASSFVVTADDYMVATTPGSLTCQTVPVVVYTALGSSTQAVNYTYTGCPVPVSPPAGPPVITGMDSWNGSDAYDGSYAGGVTTVIDGYNFENSDTTSAVTSVYFGTAAASSFEVTASDAILAVTPGSLTCQTVPVVVATSQGNSNAAYYTYTGCPPPPPAVPQIGVPFTLGAVTFSPTEVVPWGSGMYGGGAYYLGVGDTGSLNALEDEGYQAYIDVGGNFTLLTSANKGEEPGRYILYQAL